MNDFICSMQEIIVARCIFYFYILHALSIVIKIFYFLIYLNIYVRKNRNIIIFQIFL